MTPTNSDGGAVHVALAVGVGAVLLLAAVLTGAGTGVFSQQAAACQLQTGPTSTAQRAIPASYLALYLQAGQAYGVPWNVLAGIGEIESGHGRSTAPGVHSGKNAAGAAGPMQIGVGGAAGNTWGGAPIHPATQHTGGYGIDGDHDGIASVYDPGDAIPTAARFLKAHGAPADLRDALFDYNHSSGYVTAVLRQAASYAGNGAAMLTAASNPICQQAAARPLPSGVAGKVIAYARGQLGKPYLWGGTGPDSFDCSGLAMMAYRAAGIAIPRTSQQQWADGTQVPAGHEQAGDLVFFAGSDGTMSSPGHVGIVVSPGQMIDAPQSGDVVRVEPYQDRPDLVGFTNPAANINRT
jgi:cell wall-associated NlpC family hydrolase